MNQKDKKTILQSLDFLKAALEHEQARVTRNLSKSNLPDFYELQSSDDAKMQRIGYLIEDVETCLANIDIEISDALNKVERLKNSIS